MIALIVKNAWTQLRRDRAAQILAFVVPIAFFSIFAVIFGGGGNRMNGTSRVAVAVVDEERSAKSRALVEALQADSGLSVVTTRQVRPGDNARETLTRVTTNPGLDESPAREVIERFGGIGLPTYAILKPLGTRGE